MPLHANAAENLEAILFRKNSHWVCGGLKLKDKREQETFIMSEMMLEIVWFRLCWYGFLNITIKSKAFLLILSNCQVMCLFVDGLEEQWNANPKCQLCHFLKKIFKRLFHYRNVTRKVTTNFPSFFFVVFFISQLFLLVTHPFLPQRSPSFFSISKNHKNANVRRS